MRRLWHFTGTRHVAGIRARGILPYDRVGAARRHHSHPALASDASVAQDARQARMKGLPPGAIALPSHLMQAGAIFGLDSPRAVCALFGHRAVQLWANPARAPDYGWPLDTPLGRWCPECGEWL